MKDIGPRFRIAREALNLTQVEITEPLGISPTALSRFESGQRGIQSDRMLALLRLGAERGMNVDGFVLRGHGEPVRAGTEAEMLERILKAVESKPQPDIQGLPMGKRAAR